MYDAPLMQRRLGWPALLIAIAVLRMASTFRTFSQTTDEAMHVAGGLEILQNHAYGFAPYDPPLPRLFIALPLYLRGVRLPPPTEGWVWMHSVFYNQFRYETNLALARSGNLPLFAVGAICVWWLTRRVAGERAALIALLLFTTQPIVLGYSALAIHEAGAVASLAVVLAAFERWTDSPRFANIALLGVAYGIAVLCKFSCIAFAPAACVALLAVRVIATREFRLLRAIPLTAIVVLAISAAVVWAGYGFHARMFIDGVGEILRMNREGMPSYLFGRWSSRGWWWYFPAAIALKTTLPFLALFIAGFSMRRREFFEFAAASIAILAFTLSSRLDLGVRYVLPMFAPMSIAAGIAAIEFFDKRSLSRYATIALLLFHIGSSVAAHPDYFPYFNILAGRDPSRDLVDSNLDWEQDALRLRKVVRELHIAAISVRAITMIDYEALGFTNVTRYHSPFDVLHGWVAIGDSYYREGLSQGGWPQLRGQPFLRVGTSIRLYRVD